jgi:hypothetical protein
MRIVEYFPDVISKSEHMRNLANAEDLGLSLLKNDYDEILRNLYVETATVDGIERYEQMLGILHKLDDSLEDRRVAILAKLNTRLPYTRRVLIQFFNNLVGADGYTLRIDYGRRMIFLKIELSRKNQVAAIARMLRQVLPANMMFDIKLKYNQVYMLKVFKPDELKTYTVGQIKVDERLKRDFLAKGGQLIE